MPPLRFYVCKTHGWAAGSVRVNGKSLKHHPKTTGLVPIPAKGWATGEGVYGDAT